MLPNRCPGIRLLADTGYREIANDTANAHRLRVALFCSLAPSVQLSLKLSIRKMLGTIAPF